MLLLGSVISIYWGVSLARAVPGGIMGFPGIYYGTRCLMQHCDPYNVPQFEAFYERSGAAVPIDSVARRQAVTLYVNIPSTFVFVAPFALLPLKSAQTLWMIPLIGSFVLATLLMWDLGAMKARKLSTILAFVVLANCEVLFSGGNTAGLVVAFCVIAAWCFLEQRCELAGVLCLAAALAIKPHDAGLVWLFFLLSGGALRRRAMQAGALAIALVLAATLWVSVVAPHWFPELRANLAAISAHGGINEPGPKSIGVSSADMIVDLQTVFSIIRDDPGFYNAATYVICGALFCAWVILVARTRRSAQSAWFALVAASSLSMLVTYHRSYDARLLLLAIPACALLWSRKDALAWPAAVLTAATITMTSDIPLALLAAKTDQMQMYPHDLGGKLIAILIGRPAPMLLLATAAFYLWVFARHSQTEALRKENDSSG
ncbi:MAG TPA: glycosyltransferase 87 family protein [Terracidiphilus sp.]|nr:glycosyltransferase 87 family protein [Terracidiphilus sp.]